MRRFRLARSLSTLICMTLAGGCLVGNIARAEDSAATNNVATFSSPLSYQIYNILAAEMYIRQAKPAQAALHYLAAAQQSNDAKLAQKAAELANNGGDTAVAARALELWGKLDPKSVDARQYRALSHMRNKNYDEAVQDLISVREAEDKKSGKGFEYIVALMAVEARNEYAFETFKRYVEKADKSARAQLVLASLAISSDHFTEGLKAAEEAKKTGDKPQKDQAARLVAKAYMGMEQVDKAMAELAPLVKQTNDVGLKLDYGRMLILSDKRAEATPLYQSLYAAQPDNNDILYTLGLLYLEQKDYNAAEPLIKKLLAVPERAAEANYFLGQIYESRNKPKEAIDAYQKASAGDFAIESANRAAQLLIKTQGQDAAQKWLDEQIKNSDNDLRKAQLMLAQGRFLQEASKYKEAVEVFDKALELKANEFEVLYSRSLVKEKLGDFAGAEVDLRTLLKMQPENATVLNALGYMLVVNTDRFPEAEELIRKALEKRPNDAAMMDSMGWTMYRQHKLEEAETWLNKSYKALQDPEIASHLIEVLVTREKKDEAKKVLQEMLAKFPKDPMLLKLKEKQVGL